jgi:transketolase N-terminal domain/subunit
MSIKPASTYEDAWNVVRQFVQETANTFLTRIKIQGKLRIASVLRSLYLNILYTFSFRANYKRHCYMLISKSHHQESLFLEAHGNLKKYSAPENELLNHIW